VTFTEVWDAVSKEFPNSLTSDSTSIKDALNIYARQVKGGYWLLKPEIQKRVSEHSEMIAILAMVGIKKGYDVWIGKREQHEKPGGTFKTEKILADFMTIERIKVANATNIGAIENIDLLWIKDNFINVIFEVESTTSMMSALMRGSNVDQNVDKFMVIPEERTIQFKNKYKSPLFKDHFENENWKLIYFDALRISYLKHKSNINIYDLIDQKNVMSEKVTYIEQNELF
jgi:hypothetical protein